MKRGRPPVSILIISCAYLAVGSIGFVYHLAGLLAKRGDSVWVSFFELLAVLSGALMLRGENWARWLALVWIGFHVLISFGEPSKVAVHSLLFAVIAWVLFRPEAGRYFRGAEAPQLQ